MEVSANLWQSPPTVPLPAIHADQNPSFRSDPRNKDIILLAGFCDLEEMANFHPSFMPRQDRSKSGYERLAKILIEENPDRIVHMVSLGRR
jgi:hypothetical protein